MHILFKWTISRIQWPSMQWCVCVCVCFFVLQYFHLLLLPNEILIRISDSIDCQGHSISLSRVRCYLSCILQLMFGTRATRFRTNVFFFWLLCDVAVMLMCMCRFDSINQNARVLLSVLPLSVTVMSIHVENEVVEIAIIAYDFHKQQNYMGYIVVVVVNNIVSIRTDFVLGCISLNDIYHSSTLFHSLISHPLKLQHLTFGQHQSSVRH